MARYSIILPVKNGGNYVKDCVNSILAQTYTDFDLLVLDNNSTDGTLAWIQSISDQRIKVYPSATDLTMEENWGRIKNIPRNEFMTMIGHDDLLHSHYLKTMDDLIEKHPAASLYQSHFQYIGPTAEFLRFCLPMDEVQYGHEFLASHMMRIMDSMGTGYMMRTADYNQVSGMPVHYPNLIFADYELWVRLSCLNYKATTPEVCFSYRIHQNVSKTTNGEKYQQAFLHYVTFIKQFMKQNDAIRQVVRRYGNAMLLYYCEALSHRLLKSDLKTRKVRVADFIDQCKAAARDLGIEQSFKPDFVTRIWISRLIDQSFLTRFIFYMYKKKFR